MSVRRHKFLLEVTTLLDTDDDLDKEIIEDPIPFLHLDIDEVPYVEVKEVKDKGELSDGYHTFVELYHHRAVLFAVICNQNPNLAWKSFKHHDNTMYDNYFIVGIDTPEGQYSYHYHKDLWDMFKVKELDKAPEYDGHLPSDVNRLLSICGGKK